MIRRIRQILTNIFFSYNSRLNFFVRKEDYKKWADKRGIKPEDVLIPKHYFNPMKEERIIGQFLSPANIVNIHLFNIEKIESLIPVIIHEHLHQAIYFVCEDKINFDGDREEEIINEAIEYGKDV